MQNPPQPVGFTLKKTSPNINAGSGSYTDDKLASTYDLVEQVQYLYVRVVKARDLPGKDATGSCDLYVEVKLGNYKGVTKHFENKSNPEWNQVFAFLKDSIQSPVLEVFVKDKDDDLIGRLLFVLNEVPKRVPPDGPLAPQWYGLDKWKGDKVKGELMLAVWMGTQADETFPNAWLSDAATVVPPDGVVNTRSNVYHSPRLRYVRVHVFEAQDLIPNDQIRFLEVFVMVTHGKDQAMRTRASQIINPIWNEELIFVAAEPFEEPLTLTVEGRVGPNKDKVLGRCMIPLQDVQRRLDHEPVKRRCFNLEKHIEEGEQKKDTQFHSRIHLGIILDGWYHFLDESTHYTTDLRPSAEQLSRPTIGMLCVGVRCAVGLEPMKKKDGKDTIDAYCVAKYGQRWVRTRTIVDSFNPKWNEQYSWEVFDTCTVLTIGVFDNGHISRRGRDARIGKVRIRLSTLETDRVHTHSYPLLVLHSSGVKRMGEIHLAVRFTCSSLINMLRVGSSPTMDTIHQLFKWILDRLRHDAFQIVSERLSRAEPPLGREVVEYMLDEDLHTWSMRRSTANFFRLMGSLSGLIAVIKWFDSICNWRDPVTTILIHILFIFFVLHPKLILPTVFLCLFLIGIWNFRWRPRHLLHTDIRLSHAEAADPDELDEEFDIFPTSRPSVIVRTRYDRLRRKAERIQNVVGDVATLGGRFQSLLNWTDPRATILFLLFCLIAAVVLYFTLFQVVVLMGIYVLRPPIFRGKLPSVPLNFLRRLPAKSDSML